MPATALAGLALLVIGESHLSQSNYLINPLHESLSAQGAKVHAVGACGASAGDWLKTIAVPCSGDRSSGAAVIKGRDSMTTPIKQLIATDKPDLVVIIIGDTMASYDKPAFPRAWAWQGVTSLVKEVGSTKTPCVWVGPPWGQPGGKYQKNDQRVEMMSGFLAGNVAPCAYVDSLKMAKPGQWTTLDGQHFSLAGYKSWSDAITKALADLPVVQALKKS